MLHFHKYKKIGKKVYDEHRYYDGFVSYRIYEIYKCEKCNKIKYKLILTHGTEKIDFEHKLRDLGIKLKIDYILNN